MSSWFKQAATRLSNTSLYALDALGFCAEYLITPDRSLLLNSEAHDDPRGARNKLVLRQRLPRHNLTVEGVWPGLFVDQSGTYWSVPSSVNVDLAYDGFDTGLNYHVCIQHNGGTPKRFGEDQNNRASPPILQPDLCVKSAFSLKKDAEIWRAKSGKLRMVQPYDIFLSDPRVQLSGVIGAAHLTRDFFNSQQLSPSAIRSVCPDLNLSFQQQIIGPFSVRADSRITLDLKDNRWYGARVDDSVIALEYA